MVGEGVTRREHTHPFELCDQCIGTRLRRAIGFPQVPGAQLREGFRVDGADVGISRIARSQRCHGFRECRVQIGTADRARCRVPRLERKDQVALHRGCRIDAPFCLAQRLERDAVARLRERGVVDVRTTGNRHSPPRHGVCGIRGGCTTETADGLVVVEAVHEGKSLIEPELRLRVLRRYGAGEIAKPLERAISGGCDLGEAFKQQGKQDAGDTGKG